MKAAVTPRRARIGLVAHAPTSSCVASASGLHDIDDAKDLASLAEDLAYELCAFAASDPDPARRASALQALREIQALKICTDLGVTKEASEDVPDEHVQTVRACIEGTLEPALQAYCEPWMWFGWCAFTGYGFWPDLEGLEEAARSQDGVLKISAGDAWPRPWTQVATSIDFVMEVSDHGNVSLYDRRRRQVWSCV